MILKHYLDARAPDNSTARAYFVRVILVVHAQNTAGAKLVVSWPKWASAANYFGSIMRIFGTVPELEALRTELGRDALKIAKGRGKNVRKPLAISDILEVPTSAKISWIFKRHRSPSHNNGKCYMNRLIRRALARGEEPKEYNYHPIETHTLRLVSLTTNARFPLDIYRTRPEHLEVLDAEPNSYGLGVPVPHF